ncbi:MAG: transposase [Desulfuromonadales bacterium]|nr:transposase [Desulfuromonadales bacterium]
MARPLRISYPGAHYHVSSRGNEQKDIFKNRRDREKFLDYLASATQRYGAVIHAYCLMTNHYHLLLETPEANLSQIMRHINGAYTTYFNVKRKRAGHLFQGRYKAILVEADAYAAELSRYIHLNPVRAGIVKRPEDHLWSSYSSYIGQNQAAEWLKTDFILGYFGQRGVAAETGYRMFIEEMIDKEYENPLQTAIGAAVLGTADFVETVTAKHVDTRGPQREVPALRHLTSRPALDEILRVVDAAFGSNTKVARQAGMYLCHRYCGEKVREIGSRFAVGPSAITEASRHFTKRMEKDAGLAEVIGTIKRELEI